MSFKAQFRAVVEEFVRVTGHSVDQLARDAGITPRRATRALHSRGVLAEDIAVRIASAMAARAR